MQAFIIVATAPLFVSGFTPLVSRWSVFFLFGSCAI